MGRWNQEPRCRHWTRVLRYGTWVLTASLNTCVLCVALYARWACLLICVIAVHKSCISRLCWGLNKIKCTKYLTHMSFPFPKKNCVIFFVCDILYLSIISLRQIFAADFMKQKVFWCIFFFLCRIAFILPMFCPKRKVCSVLNDSPKTKVFLWTLPLGWKKASNQLLDEN